MENLFAYQIDSKESDEDLDFEYVEGVLVRGGYKPVEMRSEGYSNEKVEQYLWKADLMNAIDNPVRFESGDNQIYLMNYNSDYVLLGDEAVVEPILEDKEDFEWEKQSLE